MTTEHDATQQPALITFPIRGRCTAFAPVFSSGGTRKNIRATYVIFGRLSSPAFLLISYYIIRDRPNSSWMRWFKIVNGTSSHLIVWLEGDRWVDPSWIMTFSKISCQTRDLNTFYIYVPHWLVLTSND